ncbi:MAG: cell division protein FtsZ [Cytophagaceae bacterium]|jgi:cell division protein FtsZ|nr:cell division protein FtsZ [Cytophagaceae bacterium]
MYKFDLPTHHKSIIKVIGVGGGGSNAVNHMYNLGIKDVEFVVCNTDVQALNSSPIPNKLQIGVNLTDGLGAGANPERGKNAALESKEDIRNLLSNNTKMVFITAGMGGGTGTGAAPVIAKMAKELDVLTVGIVTAPFGFEGKKKLLQADQGIAELRAYCDTVLVIMNDRLREVYGNLSIREAFAKADNVLTTAAKSIAEIITVTSDVNVDFEDVKTVMKDSGAAVMGSAVASGEGRARRAIEEALASPLLNNTDIKGAKKILLSVSYGLDVELLMDELSSITDYISELVGDDQEMIFGQGAEAELGDAIRVTIIATGFDASRNTKLEYTSNKKVEILEPAKQITIFDAIQESEKNSVESASEVTISEYKVESFETPVEEPKAPTQTIFVEVEKPVDPTVTEIPTTFFNWELTQKLPSDSMEETPVSQEDVKQPTSYTWEVSTPTAFSPEESKETVQPQASNDTEEDYVTKVDSIKENTKSEDVLAEEQRNRLIEASKERIRKLKSLSGHGNYSHEQFKDMLDRPAYERKNVNLNDTPHSSERNISRFNLNDDNELLGNNKFLHDNVD